jgi:hypothetical protein
MNDDDKFLCELGKALLDAHPSLESCRPLSWCGSGLVHASVRIAIAGSLMPPPEPDESADISWAGGDVWEKYDAFLYVVGEQLVALRESLRNAEKLPTTVIRERIEELLKPLPAEGT